MGRFVPSHVHGAIHDSLKNLMEAIEQNGDQEFAPIISACRKLDLWAGWRTGKPVATRTLHDQLGEIRDQLEDLRRCTDPTTHRYADLEIVSGRLRHAQVETVVLLDNGVAEYTLSVLDRDCRNYTDPPLHGN